MVVTAESIRVEACVCAVANLSRAWENLDREIETRVEVFFQKKGAIRIVAVPHLWNYGIAGSAIQTPGTNLRIYKDTGEGTELQIDFPDGTSFTCCFAAKSAIEASIIRSGAGPPEILQKYDIDLCPTSWLKANELLRFAQRRSCIRSLPVAGRKAHSNTHRSLLTAASLSTTGG